MPVTPRTALAALLTLAGTLAACAPPFSELQGARLAGRGTVDVTPMYSLTHFSAEGGGGKAQDEFGLQAATGVSSRVDLVARYQRISPATSGDVSGMTMGVPGINVFVAGPKVSLVRDRLAVALPLGFAWGTDFGSSETWQARPTILGTVPLAPSLDLDLSGKALIWLSSDDDDTDNLLAGTIGLGYRPSAAWTVRPELGVLINPGETGRFWNLSVGVTRAFTLGNR
jgi:hypothetical protein